MRQDIYKQEFSETVLDTIRRRYNALLDHKFALQDSLESINEQLLSIDSFRSPEAAIKSQFSLPEKLRCTDMDVFAYKDMPSWRVRSLRKQRFSPGTYLNYVKLCSEAIKNNKDSFIHAQVTVKVAWAIKTILMIENKCPEKP